MVHTRREAPMPPLEGEVVERQRNRRGLYVKQSGTRKPLSQICRFRSADISASSPFRGALGKNGSFYHSSSSSIP